MNRYSLLFGDRIFEREMMEAPNTNNAEARDWLQKWVDYLEALIAHNVVSLRAA